VRTAFVEAAIYSWFDAHFEGAKEFANRVAVHKSGTRFEERTKLWVWPRISTVDRTSQPGRYGDEIEVFVLETICYAKVQPKGNKLLILSNLVDEVRRLVDITQQAPGQKILNAKNEVIGVVAFGPANESRFYDQSVSIGSVTIPGVDFSQLRTRCVISPVKPRVAR